MWCDMSLSQCTEPSQITCFVYHPKNHHWVRTDILSSTCQPADFLFASHCTCCWCYQEKSNFCHSLYYTGSNHINVWRSQSRQSKIYRWHTFESRHRKKSTKAPTERGEGKREKRNKIKLQEERMLYCPRSIGPQIKITYKIYWNQLSIKVKISGKCSNGGGKFWHWVLRAKKIGKNEETRLNCHVIPVLYVS